MFRSRHAWLALALSFAVTATVAQNADAAAKPHKRLKHVEPVHVADARPPIDAYLDVGALPDHGSDQRYFNDTKTPAYDLGPSIFERFH